MADKTKRKAATRDPDTCGTSKRIRHVLIQKVHPEKNHVHYGKWLRFYWDFCYKYKRPVSETDSLRQFLEKLRAKKQKDFQLKQAEEAVGFLFEIFEAKRGSGDRRNVEGGAEYVLESGRKELKTAEMVFEKNGAGFEKSKQRHRCRDRRWTKLQRAFKPRIGRATWRAEKNQPGAIR